MPNLINKIQNLITPKSSASEETITELQERTQELEHQAELAETEAKLRERANKAKNRIKAVRKSRIRPLYILIGLAFLVIVIVILVGSC